MRKSDFYYELPTSAIAQSPVTPRSASRLLALDPPQAPRDLGFGDLVSLLRPGDVLVFNETRVIPARLFGAKQSGGRVELLIERILDDARALAQVRTSKPPRPGQRFELEAGVAVRVVERRGEFYELRFEFGGSVGGTVLDILERIGHVPLPPYIVRTDDDADKTRYQTVYAKIPGAVAAPTAGLHFDEALLQRLAARGVERAFLTLHVGAGTFQPLRVDEIAAHRMHPEYVNVSARVCEQLNRARAAGGRVVAVGTTVVRALETAARSGLLESFEGETDIFITPGYRFQSIDGLVTNFHLPESTLLMLVCAFGGRDAVLAAYRHAVRENYRFYSYGDAMFLWHRPYAAG
jgi:S-adenosylmethionine:tRNA ribosyltransferase-isomerase